ncbi:hypothetical protein [Profundibacterium mesophilum]|uniref:Endonuclease exonuclease phosphatase n=1 Tax=Profundibacterium mesophilum KAUST100406-0324 TaxID=1037889 RepID=A0A921TC66_9RHOB|nr:hypothetical protein [Profundibacterium mesophilum]KAF0674502.1 endonuclease exonuclease phosphatase [Profundibacterium mesophilum KAUST100406-0324]
MRPLFWLISALFVVQTVFPLIRSSRWWIRMSDFPRLQIASALEVLLVAYLLLFGVTDRWDILYLLTVVPALSLQIFLIFPHTVAAPNQLMKASVH